MMEPSASLERSGERFTLRQVAGTSTVSELTALPERTLEPEFRCGLVGKAHFADEQGRGVAGVERARQTDEDVVCTRR